MSIRKYKESAWNVMHKAYIAGRGVGLGKKFETSNGFMNELMDSQSKVEIDKIVRDHKNAMAA